MGVSFKPLGGLTKWLIFWLKIYVAVNLISIPDTLWTHYSFTRSLASLETSERELDEMLQRMRAEADEDLVRSERDKDNAVFAERPFAGTDSGTAIPEQQAESTGQTDDGLVVEDSDLLAVLADIGSGVLTESEDSQQPQSQPEMIESGLREEGLATDLSFDSPEFDDDEFVVPDFQITFTAWDYAELLFGALLPLAFLISYTLSGIVFLKWVYRTNRNLGLFADTKPENSPSWAAWSFLVPIANIFTPPKIMQELYSIASRGAHSSLVGLWWTLAIIDYLVTKAGFRMMQRSRNNLLAFMASNESLVIDLLNAGMAAALGFATLRLVQQISDAYAANIRESTEATTQPLAEPI